MKISNDTYYYNTKPFETQFEFEYRGKYPTFSQDYNRYTYVNNNPMRFTDPSGYMAQGSGYNATWRGMAWGIANQFSEWNSNMDYMYWRGDYVMSGFGGLVAFYYYGSLLLGSGDANLGKAGMDYINTSAGVSQNEHGIFIPFSYSEGESFTMSDGETIQLSVFVSGLTFIPFSQINQSNITKDQGGFIYDGFDIFYNFMVGKAKNEWVEVAAFEVSDPNSGAVLYWIQPWKNNTRTVSENYPHGIPGFSKKDIKKQIHTHGDATGPSFGDAQWSQANSINSYIIIPNGNIWAVKHYTFGTIIPRLPNGWYGSIIHYGINGVPTNF